MNPATKEGTPSLKRRRRRRSTQQEVMRDVGPRGKRKKNESDNPFL